MKPACRDCRRELEGARDLILLLQGNLGKFSDKGDFHQLSYPDPPGEVCKPAPTRAHLPHRECVEDASPATSSTVASPAPLAEHPLPLSSILLPGLTTFPVCAGSHSSLSASQLTKPLLPLECPSPQPWVLSLPTPRSPDPVACPLPPPDSSLAPPQCDSMARSPGTVPQSCSPPNNCWLSPPVSMISGLGCSSDPVSALAWWQAAARAGRAWCLSTSSKGKSQQEHLSNRPPEASFWADSTHKQMEARGPSFINPDVQNLLEMLITKRVELKLWKGKKKGSSQKQMSPDYPFWNVTNEPEQLLDPQQLSNPKPLGDHLQQKCSQCFWGHPFLHSESLVAAAWVSGPPLEFPSVLFNVLSNSFTVQIQAKLPLQLLPPQPWHQHIAPPQPLTETLPQLQTPPLAGIHTQARLPPSLSTPPCYSPQITFCGASRPTVHMKAQFPIPTAIQQLECHLLKKQQESRRDLPTIVKKSQEVFKQLIPNSWVSQTHKSLSSHPGDVIKPELQEQLEQHLQTSFTKHQSKLPSRNQLSLGMVQPQGKFLGAGQAKEKQGSSWSLAFEGGSSQDIQDMESQGPEMWPPWKDSSLHLEHCLGSVQKDLSWDSESSPMIIPGPSSEEELERDFMSPSRSNTRNDFPGSPDKEHLEDVLKVHLSRKLGQIMENRIPVSVHHSRLAIDQALASPENSNMHIETGNLASSEGWESCEDTLQELLDPGSQRVLEAHIKRLQVRRRWGLPLKVIKAKNLFMLKKAHPMLVPHSTFPSWAICVSGDNSTGEVPNFPGEDPFEGPGEKVTTEKTVLSLTDPPPVPSPVGEDLKMDLRGTQSGDNSGHTEAPSAVQEGRWSSQPITYRIWHSEMALGAGQGSPEPSPSPAMARNELREEKESVASGDSYSSLALLELTVGSQSSGAKETTEPMEAEKEKFPAWEATLGASVRADSHTLNVNMSSESLGNSKSSLPSTIYVTQDPKELCLNAWIVSECELAVEVEPENQSQGPAPDVFLQDCTTGIFLEDCNPDAFATDIWASQPSLSSSHSKSSGDTGRACNLLSREGSKILKLRAPCESQSKTFGPTDESERCRRPKPGVHKQKSAGPRTFQTNGISHHSQDRESAESLRSKFSQLLPKEGQAPSGSSFRNKMRQFLQRIFRKKGTGQENPLQKYKPASDTTQCWGPVTGSGMAEAQELTITIGQILEENMGLHHELPALKGNWYKEKLHASVGRSCSYHRGSSHLEQRRVKRGKACSHQATSMSHSHPVKSRLVRDRESNWASPARPCQHQPRVARASSHPVCCPRHCRLPRGILPHQPEKTFLPEKLQFRQKKPILPRVSTSQIC
nr:spermatogenesis-associated protein 31E1-like isoform X2 [Microcebus murinus]